MPEDLNVYVFQLIGTKEICEIEATNPGDAFLRCVREKQWPVDLILYVGEKGWDKRTQQDLNDAWRKN